MSVKVSALDVVPVFEGESAGQAINRAVDLAKELEKQGFERYLVAEHHNIGGTTSSATSNVIQHILSNTDKIRVGAGGVMLSNHTPLQVAETYGTLDALYPGRVDLGIGRAPGTDPMTASLISRKDYLDLQDFVNDIEQIEYFFSPLENQGLVGAFPGAGANVPIIVLGSSVSSAYVAAALGLPYAFAAHINPDDAKRAIDIYREQFLPSHVLDKPYVILGTWLFAADTDEKAEKLHAPSIKRHEEMHQGKKAYGFTPADQIEERPLTSAQKILATQMGGMRLVGSRETILPEVKDILEIYEPDEIIAATTMQNVEDSSRAYQILKEAIEEAEKEIEKESL